MIKIQSQGILKMNGRVSLVTLVFLKNSCKCSDNKLALLVTLLMLDYALSTSTAFDFRKKNKGFVLVNKAFN